MSALEAVLGRLRVLLGFQDDRTPFMSLPRFFLLEFLFFWTNINNYAIFCFIYRLLLDCLVLTEFA